MSSLAGPRGLCGLLAAVIFLAAGTARSDERAPTRWIVQECLTALHSDDAPTIAAAEAELRRLGLGDAELESAREHRDADIALLQVARHLAQQPAAKHVPVLLDLLSDNNRRVRVAALEAVRVAPPDTRLRNRIEQIAAGDPDSVVKGNARLLASEMVHVAASQPAVSALPPSDPTLPSARPLPEPFVPGSPSAAAPLSEPRLTVDSADELTSLAPVQPFWNGRPVADTVSASTVLDESDYGSYWKPVPGSGVSAAGFEDGPLYGLESADDVLNRPLIAGVEGDPQPFVDPVYADQPPYLAVPFEPPNGFSGPSSVIPSETQTSSHFVPVEDRWRIGYPVWDRYGRGHPWTDDYPYVKGNLWDPYNQNVLKGDYPVIGQHTFLNVVLQERFIQNFQQVPTATTPFESTKRPFQEEFFGEPLQFVNQNFVSAQITLFHGSAAVFKPIDWQVRVTPVFNRNDTLARELAVINPDVRRGEQRTRYDFSLEEWFVEAKLADISPDYDFISARAGSQFFNSDFRGLIFADINRAIRLFGTNFGNRDQFNLLFFDQTEKDTNSLLNSFRDRHQNTLIANYYRQDFLFPGYTAQMSYHYNDDGPSVEFDKNDFLVRPDPVGVFQPHRVQAHYFGFAGDGHIGRINVSNAFYWVTGEDSRNPLAQEKQHINASLQAIELSIDRDWARFRTSFFRASGDDDIYDDTARGFDAIFDNPNFVGGEFSYWQRQAIRLFGVNVTNNNSLVANLRSSKFQGQTNFVNPGVRIVNAGVDFEITPKLRLITNANYLWFDSTRVLEVFAFQDNIDPEIGADLSMGVEYRPFLNDNVILIGGLSTLIPGKGFDDLFAKAIPEIAFGGDDDPEAESLYSNFFEIILTY